MRFSESLPKGRNVSGRAVVKVSDAGCRQLRGQTPASMTNLGKVPVYQACRLYVGVHYLGGRDRGAAAPMYGHCQARRVKDFKRQESADGQFVVGNKGSPPCPDRNECEPPRFILHSMELHGPLVFRRDGRDEEAVFLSRPAMALGEGGWDFLHSGADTFQDRQKTFRVSTRNGRLRTWKVTIANPN